MKPLTKESVVELAELCKSANAERHRTGGLIGEANLALLKACRTVVVPLADAYLAGLDAADRARVEELEGMREWAKKRTSINIYRESVITELNRRIAAIKERKS